MDITLWILTHFPITLVYLFVANTFFRKRQSHLVTFSSAQHSSQIDFVLSRRMDRRACLECKVVPRECVVVQHKLVVAYLRFHARVLRDKGAKTTRTRLIDF